MIWRIFKRRSAAIETEASEDAQTVTQVDRHSASPPSMSAFSFVSGEHVVAENLDSTDTVVESASLVESEGNLADVVRGRVDTQGGERMTERGVQPVMIPDLRELAASWRVGALRAERRRDPETTSLWRAYLSLRPDDVDGWFSLGQSYLADGDSEGASQAFLRACEMAPEYGLAHAALGFIAGQHGYWREAVARYQTAVACRPGCRDMLQELYDSQVAMGDHAAAEETASRIKGLSRE